jgi:hypothetical protein
MTPTPTQIAEWRTKAETAWIVSSDTDAMRSNKGNYEAGYIYAKTEQSAEIAHLLESLYSATNLGVVWATEMVELKAKLAEVLPLAKFGALIATNGTLNLSDDAYKSGVFKDPNFLCKHDNIEVTITKLLKG